MKKKKLPHDKPYAVRFFGFPNDLPSDPMGEKRGAPVLLRFKTRVEAEEFVQKVVPRTFQVLSDSVKLTRVDEIILCEYRKQ